MKIVVMGAGVIGVTAAYVLATRGHEVTVIDRGTEAASECSHANGSQLSYSYANSWASPRTLSMLGKWLTSREEAPLILPAYPPPSMWRWGLSFIMNCSQTKSDYNNSVLLRLGLYSKKKLEQLRSYNGMEFHHIREGNLHIFTEDSEFEIGKRKAEHVEKLGCKLEIADRERCLTIEPTLANAKEKIVGGVFAPLDESGDAHLFTVKLMDICRSEYKVKFLMQEEIHRLHTEKNKKSLAAITTTNEEITADAYVMALGSYSPLLAKQVGVKLPIEPVKGYSISFPASRVSPTVSITDLSRRVVHTTLGETARVAGIAEIAGYNTDIAEGHINQVKAAALHLFPEYDVSAAKGWSCLRAMTPSNLPIIGRTSLDNLYVNTGHGTLGWTQAAGSAFMLADIMEGKPTEISTDALLPNT